MSSFATPPRDESQFRGGWLHVTRVLDKLYLWAGYASAACICLILVVTLSQIATRYLGVNLQGISTYAGYLMAASTFLGLAHALSHGSHIRIETISKLFGHGRFYFDLFAFAVGSMITSWFAWFSCNMVHTTFVLNDISTDLDATPLWIPQATMAIGTVIFAIAMIDNFLTLLLTRKYRFHASIQTV
jgi:TRAP-type C4-dicarboxylate transport system permease small subunit